MKGSKFQLNLGLALACAAVTFSLAVCAQAQVLHTIGVFDGPNGNGPYSSVVQAPDGNIYGTTDSGGNDTQSGTLFRLTPSGKITDLYNFCSQAKCADGLSPSSAPVVGTDGNLYGVVQGGGSGRLGTFYRMTLDGEFTTLFTFCATQPCTGGGAPTGIILGGDGNFYGTTDGRGQCLRLRHDFLHQPDRPIQAALHVLFAYAELPGWHKGILPADPGQRRKLLWRNLGRRKPGGRGLIRTNSCRNLYRALQLL